MLSQKIIRWLSKNFVLQGLVVFQGRGIHEYVEILKKRCNAVGRTFCDAIKFHAIKKVSFGLTSDGAAEKKTLNAQTLTQYHQRTQLKYIQRCCVHVPKCAPA
jgi:hypothetical protein